MLLENWQNSSCIWWSWNRLHKWSSKQNLYKLCWHQSVRQIRNQSTLRLADIRSLHSFNVHKYQSQRFHSYMDSFHSSNVHALATFLAWNRFWSLLQFFTKCKFGCDFDNNYNDFTLAICENNILPILLNELQPGKHP